MEPKNGWFQLESRRPVNGSKPEGNETSSVRPVPEFIQSGQDTAKSNNVDNNTNRQKSSAAIIPSSGIQPQGKSSENLLNTEMNLNPPTPTTENKPNMPENQYKAQNPSTSWANDRTLETRHSQTVGIRGPVLEQDSILHEALEIFIHTKIPERPVHVKGFGAFGYFETSYSMREFTKLSFLQSPGQQVPVMVRFSLAAGNKGTPDTARNVRGFSTKLYTQEGIFDLLCNHIPVLFVRDGIRFPEAFSSLAPSPVNNLIDPERFWRFVARAPEATHFVTWLFSDVGTVKSLRHIRGYGVNTYVWRNAEGARRYVKYHWIPQAGEEYIDQRESVALAGMNPDIAGQDLYDTIASGTPVQYELRVQLMDPKDEGSLPYDPLDCTKVWDEQKYPLMPVGRLVLNRNPDNYMEQVEKAAFSPTNLLDGAELSDDKLLQARANIYWDSQRRRLGENFRSIPVNQQKDWTPDEQVTSGTGRQVEGHLVRSELTNPDNFTQAGQRYHSLPPEEQNHLVDNLASDLANISEETQSVVLKYLYTASAELGQRVAAQISFYTGK